MNRKIFYLLTLFLLVASCSNENTDETIDNESSQTQNDASPEEMDDLPYMLGPDTDAALKDMYGEDSVGADGNYVYPPRDTIWLK